MNDTIRIGDQFTRSGKLYTVESVAPDHVVFSVEGNSWKCQHANLARFVATGFMIPVVS